MGFLPFVNAGGQRVVRWHRLIFTWIALIVAATLGSAAVSYAGIGDWRLDISLGIAIGVFYSAVITVRGFILPVEKLPRIG
jgi:hypothetical protein